MIPLQQLELEDTEDILSAFIALTETTIQFYFILPHMITMQIILYIYYNILELTPEYPINISDPKQLLSYSGIDSIRLPFCI